MTILRLTSQRTAILLCCCGMTGAFLLGADTEPSPSTEIGLTNAIPQSVFRPLGQDERDPFYPIGYKRPPPDDGSGKVKPPEVKPTEVKLKVKYIFGKTVGIEGATKESPEELEEGKVYTYRDAIGSVEYKVVRVSEDAIVIEYDGKQKEFKMFDVNTQEKEGTNEKAKP
jgi:hypothetical protein